MPLSLYESEAYCKWGNGLILILINIKNTVKESKLDE